MVSQSVRQELSDDEAELNHFNENLIVLLTKVTFIFPPVNEHETSKKFFKFRWSHEN